MEMTVAETILVVDDNYLTLEGIRTGLEAAAYQVVLARDGAEAMEQFHQAHPHLVILDLVLPGASGWDVCKRLRGISQVPIIMLTGLVAKEDVVAGFRAGADDYVVKPFLVDELLARVHAVLRRAYPPAPDPGTQMRFGGDDLVIDTQNHHVRAYGQEVKLTPIEFELLLYLARNAGRLLPHRTIFEAVWAYETRSSRSSVKWYVHRLRSKIEKDPRAPRFIVTERSLGYRFMPL
jgi:DNA-binding response OmpR family regulator